MPNILNPGLYSLLRRQFGKVVVARAGEQAVAHSVEQNKSYTLIIDGVVVLTNFLAVFFGGRRIVL